MVATGCGRPYSDVCRLADHVIGVGQAFSLRRLSSRLAGSDPWFRLREGDAIIMPLMTFAEFEQLPDQPGKRELIDGEVFEFPPPTLKHSFISLWFTELLRTVLPFGRVAIEAGYRIGGGWLQPDVSVIHPDQKVDDGYAIGSPMLAIEVLSPSLTALQIDRKRALCFEEGTREVWVVNPKRRTMTVYRNTERIPVESSYASDLFGLTIDLTQMPGE